MAIFDEALHQNFTKNYESNIIETPTINSYIDDGDSINTNHKTFDSFPITATTTVWSTILSSSLSDADALESQYTPYNERPETYIVPIVFAIIFVVGVLGNGTLVIVFLRHRNMRNMPNTYILSLALADLLVIVTCVPFTSTVYTLESWPWGEAVCKLSECAKDISIGVSVFTLTALSAERYCAIVNPLRRFQTKPLTVFSAIFIWLLAILFAMPGAIVSNVEEIPLSMNKSIFVCSPFPPGDFDNNTQYYAKYNVVAKALIYYIVPLCVIAGFYGLMAYRLHISARDMPGELAGAQSVAQARARRHVARMVLAFILVFFICFLPYHVFMLWFHLHPTSKDDFDENWNVLRIVGFCLSFIHSCVNPVALYCVSGVFRQYFNLYLCCRDTRRVSQRGQPSINMNCETSFNSTFRRHTQITQDAFTTDTTAGGINNKQSIYRKQYLARQNTQNTSILSLDTTNNHTNRILNNKDVDFNDIDIMRKSMIEDSTATIITNNDERCRANGNNTAYGS